ncbi:uncharacterized protein LOC124205659 [Daphnia pulex]|uniref:uncharacterized protein LOC124205659 n=1 Tax=Daphnia pulex TaxID=6669 RepID=UPI001EDDAA27|nr:uncharacterized protein LOC124205659 [Daphnia pulex]
MYEKLLENELMPLINKSLNAHPRQEIIWLQQSPTIQTFRSGSVYPELIAKYNQKIRRIFKNTRVVMWDAINAVVEEYVRSCALAKLERRDKEWYSKCNDFIHPGFRALSIGTQLIINHLCEKSS